MLRIFTFVLLLISVSVLGQKPTPPQLGKVQLFTIVQQPQFTAEQNLRYNKILQKNEHDFLVFVETEYLPNLHYGNHLYFDFPTINGSETVYMKTARFNYNSNLQTGQLPFYEWSSSENLVNNLPTNFIQIPVFPPVISNNSNATVSNCTSLDFVMVGDDNGATGYFQYCGDYYMLYDLTGGTQVLIKIKDAILQTNFGCGTRSNSQQGNNGGNNTGGNNNPTTVPTGKPNYNNNFIGNPSTSTSVVQPSRPTLQGFNPNVNASIVPIGGSSVGSIPPPFPTLPKISTIDILTLATPAARAENPFIPFIAILDVARANLALINSGITNTVFNFVGFEDTPAGVTETIFAETDHITFFGNPSIQCLRDIYGADLVTIFTLPPTINNYYIIDSGWVLGIAHGIEATDGFGALITTNTASIVGNTFTHEVGHLFDCRHQFTEDMLGTFEHGHVFAYGTTVPGLGGGFSITPAATIMATNLPISTRLLRFSNPDIFIGDTETPTGITGVSENARQVENMACQVEDFRLKSDPFFADITTLPLSDCPCDAIFTITSDIPIGTFNWYLIDNATGLPEYSELSIYGAGSTFDISDFKDSGCEDLFNYTVNFIGNYTSSCGGLSFEVSIPYTTPAWPSAPGICSPLKKDWENEINLNEGVLIEPSIFPNPAKNNITISLPKSALEKHLSISISNIKGQQINLLFENENIDLHKTFNLADYNLLDGIYVININYGDNQSYKQRVVKVN